MDSNTFTPSGQENSNTIPPNQSEASVASAPVTSAPAISAPVAATPATPASTSTETVAPTETVVPTETVESAETATSTETAAPIEASVEIVAPSEAPAEAPKKKSSSKLLMIIGGLLIVVALVITVVFLIPFGENTLWQMMTGGGSNGGIGGNGGGGGNSGKVVNTGDYTYTANLDLEYQPSGLFHDGLLRAKDSDGTTVFLDTAGKLAFKLNPEYSSAGNYVDGLMPVRCGGGSGSSGLREYGASNEKTLDDYDTYSTASYGYVDKTGELVIPCQFSEAEEFINGYAAVAISREETENGYTSTNDYWGVIDTSGNVVADYRYEYIQYESGTFAEQVFKAMFDSGIDGYVHGCFDFSGTLVKSLEGNYNEKCAVDPDEEAASELAASFEDKLGGTYRVADFSEGLAGVYSSMPMEYYFIDTNGEKVWSLDINKAVDVDEEEYQEGLFLAFMWVGDDEYPGAQQMEQIMRGDDYDEEFLYRNTGAVYYDHSGNPVFIYRYAREVGGE